MRGTNDEQCWNPNERIILQSRAAVRRTGHCHCKSVQVLAGITTEMGSCLIICKINIIHHPLILAGTPQDSLIFLGLHWARVSLLLPNPPQAEVPCHILPGQNTYSDAGPAHKGQVSKTLLQGQESDDA